MDALAAIAGRRSTGRLSEPGPTADQLDVLLRAAAAAPDHGQLRPFRFVVLEGGAKDAFGAVLEAAYRRRCEVAGLAPDPGKLEKERTKLGRAPLVVAVGAVRQRSGKIPWDEQVAAAAAATQNLLLAATALGFGSMWRTGDPCYDDAVKAELGLGPEDALVGFVYVGTYPPGSGPEERVPDLDGVVLRWEP